MSSLASSSQPARRLKAGLVDVKFGVEVTVVEPCNLYGCELGDKVFVGPFVEIQRNVRIGARTKVQSHAFICELVTIGDDCFIGHGAAGGEGVTMAFNDRWVAREHWHQCHSPAGVCMR